VQGLLRPGVMFVALGAEYHESASGCCGDRRRLPSDILMRAGGQIVADEELIDDELDFFRVQIDVAAPTNARIRG